MSAAATGLPSTHPSGSRPAAFRARCAIAAIALPFLVAAGPDGSTTAAETTMERRSEDQRAVIRHFFAGLPGGVFVDVGAAHYRDGSMTWFLERELGWSGIAVDALEDWAPGYRVHRPRTRFFTYIVTDASGAEQPFYRLTGDIGSTSSEARAKAIASQFEPVEIQELLVPTITLDTLLDREKVKRIDFLSMDIEGGEPKALAGFDIERFRPELVGIEAMPENHEAILRYMTTHGYRRIDTYLERDPRNWFFTPAEKPAPAEQP